MVDCGLLLGRVVTEMWTRPYTEPKTCGVCGAITDSPREIQSYWMDSFWVCTDVKSCIARRPELGPTP